MNIDEQTVVDTLHGIEAAVPADFVSRVRAGGRRRVVRRRAYAAVGAVAVAGVATPVGLGLRGGTSKIEPAQRVYPGLFAPPPAPGSQCNAGSGAGVSQAVHPDLLLLPPVGEPATALVRPVKWSCADPHVALTALMTHGSAVEAGLVVEGPNAPTPEEIALSGPGVGSAVSPDRLPIHGQPATEFRFANGGFTDIYWTEADGGQWHAVVRGMDEAQAVELVNRVSLDSGAGTATLPDAVAGGWTVEPSTAVDVPSDGGQMYVDWTDFRGHAVDMTVMHGPDRVDEFAAGGPAGVYRIEGYRGPVEFVSVRGHHAVLGTGGTTLLFWQEAPDVEVTLTINRGDEAEVRQVAESLVLASPDDPRISKD
jgi:hypothetical protein